MSRLTQWLFDKPRRKQGDVFAALDIGSSKIACLIARADEQGQPRIIGAGHRLSEGVRGGLISDMEAVQRTITATVASAEQMAGENIEHIVVNIASPLLLSQTVGVEIPLHGREITQTDMERMLAQSQTMVEEDPQGNMLELIHTIPVHYILDGQHGIRDPQGMIGNSLQTKLHLVSAAFGPVRTLVTAVARCHLEVDRLVSSPYASGIACLVEDEMDLGCTLIDLGAGTTSIGIFFDGYMIHNDGVAIGGSHITSDIARMLTTTLGHAERMKTLYGSAISSPLDDRDMVEVPQVGEEESPDNANHIPKSHLIRIIQPRLEEIFEMVRVKLEKSGFSEEAGRRVVITGGASQLPGIRDIAQRVLEKQVRLGKPLRISRPSLPLSKEASTAFSGLAETTSGPAFATTAGLLAMSMQPEFSTPRSGIDLPSNGLTARIGQWFKQNL